MINFTLKDVLAVTTATACGQLSDGRRETSKIALIWPQASLTPRRQTLRPEHLHCSVQVQDIRAQVALSNVLHHLYGCTARFSLLLHQPLPRPSDEQTAGILTPLSHRFRRPAQ